LSGERISHFLLKVHAADMQRPEIHMVSREKVARQSSVLADRGAACAAAEQYRN
jgi:hypothetical protein